MCQEAAAQGGGQKRPETLYLQGDEEFLPLAPGSLDCESCIPDIALAHGHGSIPSDLIACKACTVLMPLPMHQVCDVLPPEAAHPEGLVPFWLSAEVHSKEALSKPVAMAWLTCCKNAYRCATVAVYLRLFSEKAPIVMLLSRR